MKKRIDIASITSSKLRKGEYKSVLPEYYALSLVSENNPWHVNQNVFDHSVAVFVGLEGVLKLNFLKGIHKIKIQKHLDEKIGKSARKELLIVATVLHDIAKKDLLIKLPSGNTVCPAHEVIGSTIVKNFT
jgi:hypothetical protein